jgi:hypothetical protein
MPRDTFTTMKGAAQVAYLDKRGIIQLLTELDEELVRRGICVNLDVYGGSAMALAYNDLRVSRDVDAVASTANHNVFRRAVTKIAERHRLDKNWLNEAVMSVVSEDMFAGRLQLQQIDLRLRNLSVRVPSPSQMLAMKLYAARDKDLADAVVLARALGITGRAQLEAVVRQYYRPDSIKRQNRRRGGHNQVYNAVDAVAKELFNDVTSR